jgi:hypothetical protein
VSVPIEPIGSAPVLASGATSSFSSSSEYPKACCRRVVEVDPAGVQPLVVRVLPGEVGLDLLVVHDPAVVGVDQKHLARLQPALLDHGGGVEL